jgi:pimeloyl-ACP methyl ester carboxylesterase
MSGTDAVAVGCGCPSPDPVWTFSMTATSRRRLHALAAAGALAGFAAANFLEARRARRAYPPLGRFVEIDGVKLHVVEKGAGAPILLIHGNGVMLDDWIISGLFDELAKTHRVIAVDRPGFGHSSRPRGTRWWAQRQADLFAKLLEELDAAPALVVGHSFGSLVAAAMAVHHADKLKGAVLIGGFYYPEARADIALLAPNALPGCGDLLNHTFMPLAGEALRGVMNRKLFGPAPTPQAWREHFSFAMALRPTRMRAGAADAVNMNGAARRLAPHYGKVALPVTLIVGAGDRIVSPRKHTERLHEALPNSRLVDLEGAGHMAHHSRMSEVAAAVRMA